MIDKNLIKKIMKSIIRRESGLSDHHIMHPAREWFLSLAIASLILGVAVFLCTKLYWFYSSLGPSSDADIDTPIVIYRAEEIETALTEFAERKKTYDTLKGSLTAHSETSPLEIPAGTSTAILPGPLTEEVTLETQTDLTEEMTTLELDGQ